MDEDSVVLEGSPLAEHLKTLGLGDAVENVELKEEVAEVQEIRSPQQSLWEVYHRLVGVIRTPAVWTCYRKLALITLLKSKVMGNKEINEVMIDLGITEDCTHKSLKWTLIKLCVKDLLIGLLPMIAAGFLGKEKLKIKIITLVPAITMFLRWSSAIPAHLEYSKLRKYLGNLMSFQSDLRDAICLLNEASLITNGYILNSGFVRCAWRLENKSSSTDSILAEKSLPGLRLAVWGSTLRLAKQYSTELRAQSQVRPFHFIHDIPEHLPSENIHYHEDNPYIPTLRDIKVCVDDFSMVQQSLLENILLELVSPLDDYFQVFVSDKLVEILLNSINELKAALILYRTIYYCAVQCKLQSSNVDKLRSPINNVHMLCHTAKGHLDEAMRNTLFLEDYLEKNTMLPINLGVIWELTLSKINLHMDTSKECFQRASLIVSREKTNNEKNEVVSPSENTQNISRTLFEEAGFTPVDEIFEVYGECSHFHDKADDDWGGDMEIMSEEKSLVMKELKTVIQCKALNWKKREMIIREMGNKNNYIEDNDFQDIDNRSLNLINIDFPSTSSQTDGEEGVSHLSSVITKSEDQKKGTDIVENLPEDAYVFDESLIGKLATQAVARARLIKEEEYAITSDEDT